MIPLQLDPYVAWAKARFDEARSLSPDTLLIVIAGAALLIVLLFLAWRSAARKARSMRRALASVEAELASSRANLHEEIKWRRAAEKAGAQMPKLGAGSGSASSA